MPVVSTIIAGIGLAVGAAGTATQLVGAQKQAKAQKQVVAAQLEAEAARKKQMELDANRKKREIIRQTMVQRSQALAVATNQGAAGDGSSALAGAEGQLNSESTGAIKAVNQNEELGVDVFEANSAATRASGRAAAASTMTATGSGISSLGGAIVTNSGTIAKIGGWK